MSDPGGISECMFEDVTAAGSGISPYGCHRGVHPVARSGLSMARTVPYPVGVTPPSNNKLYCHTQRRVKLHQPVRSSMCCLTSPLARAASPKRVAVPPPADVPELYSPDQFGMFQHLHGLLHRSV